MSSMRDIKQRKENVSSVKQIVRAMDMVASTKLVKVRAQLEGVRPTYHELKRIAEDTIHREGADGHIFYREREVKNSLYIILTGDRGLSGSYDSNVIAKALEHMKQAKNVKILIVGSKGAEYFRRKDMNVIRKITGIADSQVYFGTERLSKWLTDFYISGEAEEVFIAYTHFENVLSYVPVVEKLLPVGKVDMENAKQENKKFEPNIDTFIDHMIPLYLHMNLFRAFSESHTSEQAARMVNMDAAGKNASEIIDELTRMYNRKRQAAITQELSEIVGSANIMKKGDIHDS